MTKQPFELFFKQHAPRIYHQIKRLNIHPTQYDDFYTEGLIALWDAYNTYDIQKGNISTYINYTIRYQLLDHLRKKIRQNTIEKNYHDQLKVDLTNGNRMRHTHIPLLEFNGHNMSDPSLWKTIQEQLSEKQWKWVKYFIIAELSIKEIKELENVSANTVKSWGREAKKKLKTEAIKQAIKDVTNQH